MHLITAVVKKVAGKTNYLKPRAIFERNALVWSYSNLHIHKKNEMNVFLRIK